MAELTPVSSTNDDTPLPPSERVRAAVEDRGEWPAVPGYDILGELGRGGMGIVYKARQLELNRIVALKVIRKDRLSHPDTVRRFRREVQAIARLSHPHLVMIYDADRLGETYFFSMQYLEGVTLQRLVQEQGPLPVATACDYVRQVALGLQHAFECGLVHRDIKPANLMLVTGGMSGESADAESAIRGPTPSQDPALTTPPLPTHQVKILDLGLARLRQPLGLEDSVNSTFTEQGAVIGTLDYIAPEQARDPRTADIRADLYSLGCTFFFLLTGKVPFPEGTWLDKLDSHRNKTPVRADAVRPGVPQGVSDIVQRLLAKERGERFQTPSELAAALEPFCRGEMDAEPSPMDAPSAPASETIDLPEPAGMLPPPTPIEGAESEFRRLAEELRAQLGRGDLKAARETVTMMLLVRPNDLEALTARAVIEKFTALPDHLGEQRRLVGHKAGVTSVAFTSDGRHALTASRDGTARLWELETGLETRLFQGHHGSVNAAVFVPGDRFLVSAGDDKTLRLWDVATGQEVRRFSGHRERVCCAAVSSDGTRVLSAGGALGARRDNSVCLWDIETGKRLAVLKGHTDQVNSVAFSPDGERAVSGSQDGTLRLWDLKAARELVCFQGHVGAIHAVACSHNGFEVLYAGETVRLLDLQSEGELCLLYRHPEAVSCLAFAPDGRRFLAGSFDMKVRLWDVGSGQVGRQQQQKLLGIETVVRVWENTPGAEPIRFEGHTGQITSVAFSPDGRRALSASLDRTVRLWGLPVGEIPREE